MTSRDFTFWLQGFFEIQNPKYLDKKQIKTIQSHISLVFKYEPKDDQSHFVHYVAGTLTIAKDFVGEEDLQIVKDLAYDEFDHEAHNDYGDDIDEAKRIHSGQLELDLNEKPLFTKDDMDKIDKKINHINSHITNTEDKWDKFGYNGGNPIMNRTIC